MSPSKHSCICGFDFCKGEGGEASVRIPEDKRAEWQGMLGRGGESCTRKDPRVSLTHFSADSVEASTSGSGAGGTVVKVRVAPGATPSQTNDQMYQVSKGALGRWLKAQAICKRHEKALLEGALREHYLETRIAQLTSKVKEFKAKERVPPECKETKPASKGIDVTILAGLADETARSLCGVRSQRAVELLYDAINVDGAADFMHFYDGGQTTGVKEDGSRPKKRRRIFGGPSGLFFALFVLRTGTSIRVASTLFGTSETTGGRAFTTWLNFMYGSFRPFLRLPDVDEVESTAPPNFRRKQMEKVVVVLDATETQCERVWQTDAAAATFSNYKSKPTGKVLIGITPGGAICYVSDVYGGKTSDVDIVKDSGVIDDLGDGGFGDSGGYSVMADRGFNSIAPLLLQEGIYYVAPPSKRKDEDQFEEEDASFTRDVANLRIHVERAIGAVKQWHILDGTFDSQQIDNMAPCYVVCAALVNMLHGPFASVD